MGGATWQCFLSVFLSLSKSINLKNSCSVDLLTQIMNVLDDIWDGEFFPQVFNGVCPDLSNESLSVAAIGLQNVFS